MSESDANPKWEPTPEQLEDLRQIGLKQGQRIAEQIRAEVTRQVAALRAELPGVVRVELMHALDEAIAEHMDAEHPQGELRHIVDTAVSARFERYGDLFAGLNRFEERDGHVGEVVDAQEKSFAKIANSMLDGRFAQYVMELHKQAGTIEPWTQEKIDTALTATAASFDLDAIDAAIDEELDAGEQESEAAS